MERAKTKIINILYHPPAYESYRNSPRPEINWDTPDGSWVGIWGYDIPNQFGNEILRLTDEFEYEVWQPDLRADKVYSHRFENGMLHALFPAHEIKKMFGLKILTYLSSDSMLEKLQKISKEKIILHLHSLGNYINYEILRNFPDVLKVINFHSKTTSIPRLEARRLRRNILSNIVYLKRHIELKRNRKIFFTYNNSNNISELSKYEKMGVERIFTGCDFDYWTSGDKEVAKKKWGFHKDTFIFSMASRFFPIKQIDKIISILDEIQKRFDYNFKLIIAGHGPTDYENYLKKISEHLLNTNKLEFAGFLEDNEMRSLYHASDLFISASIAEGGPTTIVKAIACNTPVMCTRVNGVDDYLVEDGSGIIVDNRDYREWFMKIKNFLARRITVKIMDREKARKTFHWPNIAKKMINIYGKLGTA